VAARARPAASKLVDCMVNFQFDNDCDYFTIDPVAYAPALGAEGMASYRVKLDTFPVGEAGSVGMDADGRRGALGLG
jgi:hypothetical protein